MNKYYSLVILSLCLSCFTLSAQEGVGVNTDTVEGQLHITTNSSLGYPQLRLTEEGNDYARIKFENTNFPDSYWDLAALVGEDSSTAPRLNMFFYNGESARDLFLMTGTGELYRNSFGDRVFDRYFVDNSYRGGLGYDSVDFRVFTSPSFGGKVRLGTKNRDNIIIDALGNVGIGNNPDTVDGELHINTNSSIGFPHVRLTESGNDFARIKFESDLYPNSYWDIAGASGTDSTGINAFNLFYYRDTIGRNLFSLTPGILYRDSHEDYNYNYYYEKGQFQGGFGFQNDDYRLFTGFGSNGRIRIGTRFQNHIVIDTVGNVGIGQFSPDADLHVAGTHLVSNNAGQPHIYLRDGTTGSVNGLNINLSSATANIINRTNGYALNLGTNNIVRLTIESDGDLDLISGDFYMQGGRLTYGTAEYLEDSGPNQSTIAGSIVPDMDNVRDLGTSSLRYDDVYATNGTIQTSDRRDKTAITPLEYGLATILLLEPVSFEWKDNAHQGAKLGLIAQDVLEVIPEVVKTHDRVFDEDGTVALEELDRMGMYYSDMVPVLIKALQEQNDLIVSLQAENNSLRTTQEAILEALEAQGISVND